MACEALGTGLLLACIVGSGIMGDRLAAGNDAIALLVNSAATGAMLVALISTLGPISGAHLNPAVTLSIAWQGSLPWREVPSYLGAQIIGAGAGVAAAHAMFGVPFSSLSHRPRGTPGEFLSELVATFGLLTVIRGCSRSRAAIVPFAVGAYIMAGFWFTASTSFANPAVTCARAFTDTFTGIRPGDVPAFLLAQLLGAAAATALCDWLVPTVPSLPSRQSERESEAA
jgi:glycerol uptake facilitator-like aquaporin